MKKGGGEQACMARRRARDAMDFSPPDSEEMSRYFLEGGMAEKMMPPSPSKGSPPGFAIISFAAPPVACSCGQGWVVGVGGVVRVAGLL